MTHNFNLTDLEKESIYAIVIAIAVDIDEGGGDYNLIKQLLKHIYQDEVQRKDIMKFLKKWIGKEETNIGKNTKEFFAINGDLKEIQELFTKK